MNVQPNPINRDLNGFLDHFHLQTRLEQRYCHLKMISPTFVCDERERAWHQPFQTFRAALWTIVSLCIWWQLFSTRSSSFSKFIAHELRMSLLSFATWIDTIPIGLSIFATRAFDTTISERCFSASYIGGKKKGGINEK